MIAAVPPHLAKNLGIVNSVPTCYFPDSTGIAPDPPNSEPDASTIAAMKLFERFCQFPTEAERLAMWGLTEESPESANSDSSSRSAGGKKSAAPKSSSWFGSDITWEDPRESGVYPPTDFKNQRFKLSCKILEGPWVVRTSVPNVPVMLGQKVVLRYFRGNGYVEVDVHIASSAIALRTVGTVRNYAKYFSDEIGVWLQGETDAELPERILCVLSMIKPDCEVNRSLYD
jgi:hypothetical protein